MKRIFLDTNILLDIFLKREPLYSASAKVFESIESRKYKGFISAQSFSVISHILANQTLLRSLLNGYSKSAPFRLLLW